MTELQRMIVTTGLGFLGGLLTGILLEKYREKRRAYDSVLDAYFAALRDQHVRADEWKRFAAIQKAGAWKLTPLELKKLTDEALGRGFGDPFEAWRSLLPQTKDFPKAFLVWAQRSNVDFEDEDVAAKAVLTQYAIKVDPPERFGAWLV